MHDELPPDRAAVLERLRAVIGCRTQAELAAALGISQTAPFQSRNGAGAFRPKGCSGCCAAGRLIPTGY